MVWPLRRRSKEAPASGSEADEVWSESGQEVKVLAREDGHRVVQCRAKVPLHPDDVYSLLIHPQNWKVFKSQAQPESRVVTCDRGYEQEVHIVQRGKWRFLMFSGSFPVKLKVLQSRKTKTVDFELMERSGFMKHFDGQWRVTHFDSAALEETATLNTRGQSASGGSNGLRQMRRAVSDFKHRIGIKEKDESVSLVTLRHELKLRVQPPPAIERLVNKIAGGVMRQTLAQMQDEAKRVNEGNPTLGKSRSA
mmetsp:Transcript_17302/g.42506  ORF Transcript_17302/g.42506 Transcript_17302/m.42506 type:complete len:251 (-) Transcript_17302:64-816(-)